MKKLLTYIKTTSWGGMEGRTFEEDKFTTIEAAKKHAEADTWNTGYRFYEVILLADEDGIIEEEVTEIKQRKKER